MIHWQINHRFMFLLKRVCCLTQLNSLFFYGHWLRIKSEWSINYCMVEFSGVHYFRCCRLFPYFLCWICKQIEEMTKMLKAFERSIPSEKSIDRNVRAIDTAVVVFKMLCIFFFFFVIILVTSILNENLK